MTSVLPPGAKPTTMRMVLVGQAAGAEQARAAIGADKPDALFLDIKMPGEDGFSLLRSITDLEIPVVFVTAYDEYALQAFKENALDYLEKPLDQVELERAVKKGIFGTKMRSVIAHADKGGIAAVVKQQFEVARQIIAQGLVPIVEPEVSIKSPTKREAEAILRDEIAAELDRLPAGDKVMLKLTIPTVDDFYAPLVSHPSVIRVVALSGGYSTVDACEKLSHNHGMIASFSRALAEKLRVSMSDAEFTASIAATIEQIYAASVNKAGAVAAE